MLLLSPLLFPAYAATNNTFKYQEEDGTVWFTNRKPVGADFKRFEFVGYHGRPTATASCRGVTKKQLYSRAAQYDEILARYAQQFGVSKALIKAIIYVESCFDDQAVSAAGAQGLMQLMPSTAKWLGVSNPFDPNQNLRGGIQYFHRLQKKFENNDRLALAAYNAGPGAVRRYKGIPPYPETRSYVRRVMAKFKHFLVQDNGSRFAGNQAP